MAFLASNNQNNVLSGGGGYAGEGATVGDNQQTTAGKPSGWTNIQDFLTANPQTPNVQSRLQQKGSQQLGEAKKQYEQQVSALPTMPTPEQFSQDKFGGILGGGVTSGEAQNLRGYLDQSYKPQATPQELLPGVASPYKDIQPGSFDSIMNWYGNIERPSAAYTPGMQKMDELLLRGQSGFAEKFPTQMNEQYQSQIAQPLEAKRAEVGQQQEAATNQFSDAGKQWYEGISGFLGGENQKISDAYKQQQAELAKQSAMTPQQIMGQDYWNAAQQFQPYDTMGGMTKPSPGMGEYQQYNVAGINPNDFISREAYSTPTMSTAAQSMYSPEQLNTYNVLSGLLPQEDYGQYTTGEAFNPGNWSFDQSGFTNDYKRVMRQIAEEKAKGQMQYAQSLPNVQIQQGMTPEQAGLYSYNVPSQISTPYGETYLTLPEAGSTIWQPYSYMTPPRPLTNQSDPGGGGGYGPGGGSSGSGSGSSGGDASGSSGSV